MGKQCSKCVCENKDTIVTQGAGGNAEANEEHIWTNNILFSILLALAMGAVLVLAYKQYNKCHQSMVRRELRDSTFERIKARFSGRRSQQEDAGPNP